MIIFAALTFICLALAVASVVSVEREVHPIPVARELPRSIGIATAWRKQHKEHWS